MPELKRCIKWVAELRSNDKLQEQANAQGKRIVERSEDRIQPKPKPPTNETLVG